MKKYIKNLFSINNNVFRFLHDAEGFDFEKPYFIAEQPGKFTVNTVTKAVQEELRPTQCKIAVFVVPTKASNKEGLYFASAFCPLPLWFVTIRTPQTNFLKNWDLSRVRCPILRTTTAN